MFTPMADYRKSAYESLIALMRRVGHLPPHCHAPAEPCFDFTTQDVCCTEVAEVAGSDTWRDVASKLQRRPYLYVISRSAVRGKDHETMRMHGEMNGIGLTVLHMRDLADMNTNVRDTGRVRVLSPREGSGLLRTTRAMCPKVQGVYNLRKLRQPDPLILGLPVGTLVLLRVPGGRSRITAAVVTPSQEKTSG